MNELHLHIDGSLRRKTLNEWRPQLTGRPFGFKKGMTLQACLECFGTTVAVLNNPSRLTRAVKEICADQRMAGIQKTELRFAPHIHGFHQTAAITAAVAGLDSKTTLILCGLYGDNPDVLSSFVDAAKDQIKIVGIDLAGAPSAEHKWELKDYAEPYTFAKQVGIGRTVHAAEGRPPQEIVDAITLLHAQRIGHACTLEASERAVALVKERGVVIEACLTSNVHVGVFRAVEEHPIKNWIKNGIRVSICADNTLMSNCDTMTELAAAKKFCRLDEDDIRWIEESSNLGLFSGGTL